jgi:hypothetical protein
MVVRISRECDSPLPESLAIVGKFRLQPMARFSYRHIRFGARPAPSKIARSSIKGCSGHQSENAASRLLRFRDGSARTERGYLCPLIGSRSSPAARKNSSPHSPRATRTGRKPKPFSVNTYALYGLPSEQGTTLKTPYCTRSRSLADSMFLANPRLFWNSPNLVSPANASRTMRSDHPSPTTSSVLATAQPAFLWLVRLTI